MLSGFKNFIFRGNVVDLAVAVVIGAAFAALVTSLVTHVINPLIAALVGKPDFSALAWSVHGSKIEYGLFLNALVSFVLVAAAIYFFVVAPLNKRALRKGEPAPPSTQKCPECLSEIPIGARRCAHCTATLPAAAGGR